MTASPIVRVSFNIERSYRAGWLPAIARLAVLRTRARQPGKEELHETRQFVRLCNGPRRARPLGSTSFGADRAAARDGGAERGAGPGHAVAADRPVRTHARPAEGRQGPLHRGRGLHPLPAAAGRGSLCRCRRHEDQGDHRRDHRDLAQEPRRRQPVLGPHSRHALRPHGAGLGHEPLQGARHAGRAAPGHRHEAAVVPDLMGGGVHGRRQDHRRSRAHFRSRNRRRPRDACRRRWSGSASAPPPIFAAATSTARR